jgi:hypothetical protein
MSNLSRPVETALAPRRIFAGFLEVADLFAVLIPIVVCEPFVELLQKVIRGDLSSAARLGERQGQRNHQRRQYCGNQIGDHRWVTPFRHAVS